MSAFEPAAPAGIARGQASAHEAPAFFRYHGLLAPGVRVFRRIGFPAKSA